MMFFWFFNRREVAISGYATPIEIDASQQLVEWN